MPFTEEQMKQVFDTNIIDFAVSHGFEVEKKPRGELVLPPKDKDFNRTIAYLPRICWIVGIGDLENIHYSR